MFWSVKDFSQVLCKLKSRGFGAISLSTFDFSTLYTTLDLLEFAFKMSSKMKAHCFLSKKTFFTSTYHKIYKLWSCQNESGASSYLLVNMYIIFSIKYLIGTNCAPLVSDLFLFCYERDFMTSLSDDDQADMFEAYNTTSKY